MRMNLVVRKTWHVWRNYGVLSGNVKEQDRLKELSVDENITINGLI
jgi:hypothetical protein